MKESRFAEVRIIEVLREQEVGAKTAHVCRKHRINERRACAILGADRSTVHYLARRGDDATRMLGAGGRYHVVRQTRCARARCYRGGAGHLAVGSERQWHGADQKTRRSKVLSSSPSMSGLILF